MLGGDIDREAIDLILAFNVADENVGRGDQLLHLFATLRRADGVHDRRPGFFQHPGRVPGDALLVRDAANENRFARQLKKIDNHAAFANERER